MDATAQGAKIRKGRERHPNKDVCERTTGAKIILVLGTERAKAGLPFYTGHSMLLLLLLLLLTHLLKIYVP